MAKRSQITDREGARSETVTSNPLEETDCVNFRSDVDPSLELEDFLSDVTEQNLHESKCTCKPVGREFW